jgi:hypothetical protein
MNMEALVVRRLWQMSPELVATAALMAPVLAGSLVGLAVDPTIITGAPAWLKPAKFAVSIIVYTLTLSWVFTFIPEWARTRRMVGWGTALTMVLEMAIIAGQAWRGTASHFNVSTTQDAILFGVMGLAIVAQTVSTIAVAVALWRQRFADPALGWALRLGMSVTIAGALTGGLMTRPTADQVDAVRAGARMTVAGAHTVGGPDGGPGVIGTGWSTEHGDVRVPHFVGLHALQALPLVALLLGLARLRGKVRERLVVVAGASYAGLFAILLIQALRGVPLIAPDTSTMIQFATWAIATAAAASLAWFGNAPQTRAMTTL